MAFLSGCIWSTFEALLLLPPHPTSRSPCFLVYLVVFLLLIRLNQQTEAHLKTLGSLRRSFYSNQNKNNQKPHKTNIEQKMKKVCLFSCCCCCYVASVVSDSVQPHRRQPNRLPCPWDSPGKNTGVGCHFLLKCMKVKSESEVAQSCLTLSDPMDCSPPGSSIHGTLQARVLEWVAIAFSNLFSWTEVKWSRSVVSHSLRPHGLEPTRLLGPWDFPGKSTGVGCHFLLQGIFPTQGSNPGLPRWRQMLYHLSYQGSPSHSNNLLSWELIPFKY